MAETADYRLRFRFWGVRGATPTPQIENFTFGGNTSCLEVRSPFGEASIFDAGSGIRNLGGALVKDAGDSPVNVSLFLTHFHWDHIQGLPFFAPLYGPGNHISFYTGVQGRTLEETLEGQMARPYFPVDFSQVSARRHFQTVAPGASVAAGELKVFPFPLNHPQGASGYRIESNGAAIVYATDYEHGNPELDRTLRDYSAAADALICDAQYTPEEYERHRGWGHSTWLNAAEIARDAGVKRLFLFHHDPDHDDTRMKQIAEEARLLFEDTTAAFEGLTVDV